MFHLKLYDQTLLSFEIVDMHLEGQKCQVMHDLFFSAMPGPHHCR